jgi:large subunit ribosomal protein L29
LAILKKKQLKEMADNDMINRLSELRLELAKDRGQIALGGTPSNPGRVREVRRTIAKIITEQKRRSGKTA